MKGLFCVAGSLLPCFTLCPLVLWLTLNFSPRASHRSIENPSFILQHHWEEPASSVWSPAWPRAWELPLEPSWQVWPGSFSTSPRARGSGTQQTSENYNILLWYNSLTYAHSQGNVFSRSLRGNSPNNVQITFQEKSFKFHIKRHQPRVRILPSLFLSLLPSTLLWGSYFYCQVLKGKSNWNLLREMRYDTAYSQKIQGISV